MAEKRSAPKEFRINPFPSDPAPLRRAKTREFPLLVQTIDGLHHDTRAMGGLKTALTQEGILSARRFGHVFDEVKMVSDPHALSDPLQRFFIQLNHVSHPQDQHRSHVESLQLIRQLISLGFRVSTPQTEDPRHAVFLRAAQRAGAKIEPMDADEKRNERARREAIGDVYPGMIWARDEHVKIAGKTEKPRNSISDMISGQTHLFGEGGAMVQIAPKVWAVSQYILNDPRVKKYEKQGHQFIAVPDGFHYDRTMSLLLRTPIYNQTPHIDFNLGAIPEKRVLAVCPHYRSEHRLTVDLLEKNFKMNVVEVPKEEADRHPQNFLPLGNGRVLVDAGAPRFIEALQKAGVHAIPTAVPLDTLLVSKGGLHCLFNEV